ncbi:MAG: uroporphyrinogen decarboxylase family protein [Candidatus Glassbacteria bacterium]
MQKPDRVPRFDQTVCLEVASAVLGREVLVGGGTLRFREVAARFESEQAGREFEDRMIEDIAAFYRGMDYDMARMPWRDRRQAARKLDEYTYLFGDEAKEGPWEVYRYDPGTFNWHQADGWLAGGDVDRLSRWLAEQSRRWQGPDEDPSRMDEVTRLRELVGQEMAICHTIGYLGIPMWEPAWLMALELAPELVAQELDRQVDQARADLELAERIGVDVALAGGDFCTKSGPAFSPATFDRLWLPRLQQIVQKCNETGIKYVFRTDGVTWPVADSLLGKSGVHGYGEIDYGAGMRLGELRAKFPGLTLFGNLDCGGELVFGTPEEVRARVRSILAETGGIGHVVGSSNAVMPETPPQNYLAMLDEEASFRL